MSKLTHPFFLVYELTSLRVNKLFVVIMICGIRVIRFRSLQQCGVISFEIRSLKKGRTEQRRTRRFYITAIVRQRGSVGAWRNRGYLRVLLMFLSTSLQSSGLQDVLKRL